MEYSMAALVPASAKSFVIVVAEVVRLFCGIENQLLTAENMQEQRFSELCFLVLVFGASFL